MLKTIKPQQTEQRHLSALEPGMVVSEGVVLTVEMARGVYVTPAGTFDAGDGNPIPVLCKVTEEMVEILASAVAEQHEKAMAR